MTHIESYPDALRWLYGRNQFAIKLGLDGPRKLLREMGHPEQGGVFLHVAGTNGKGSVCANLAALLPALGFRKVGLYTSPHLVSFRERIRVDGRPIPPLWVTGWLRRQLPLLEELNPTYFECVTAMALAYFKEAGCEVVVLETGLGGRLDATNVVTPRVSAITSISLDHVAILGGTLEAIWKEKLGIVKPGIPLIVDEERPALAQLAKSWAQSAGAPFLNLAERWDRVSDGFRIRGAFGEYQLPHDLRAEAHQMRNAGISVLALEAFHGRILPDFSTWIPALRQARLPGRTQWIEGEGMLPVLLDGAHNPDGVEGLCSYLHALGLGQPRIFFAVMRDKEYLPLFETLREISSDIVYLDLASAGGGLPRALSAADLRAALSPEKRDGLREASIAWASLEPLLLPGSGADYAVLCGSLYLLGEVIPLLWPHYHGLEEFAKMAGEEMG